MAPKKKGSGKDPKGHGQTKPVGSKNPSPKIEKKRGGGGKGKQGNKPAAGEVIIPSPKTPKAEPSTEMGEQAAGGENAFLTEAERARAVKLFKILDSNRNGMIDNIELGSIVDGDERAQMLEVLDTDGDGEVSPEEWLVYLQDKKKDKGPRRFQIFISFIEESLKKMEKSGSELHVSTAVLMENDEEARPASPADEAERMARESLRLAKEASRVEPATLKVPFRVGEADQDRIKQRSEKDIMEWIQAMKHMKHMKPQPQSITRN